MSLPNTTLRPRRSFAQPMAVLISGALLLLLGGEAAAQPHVEQRADAQPASSGPLIAPVGVGGRGLSREALQETPSAQPSVLDRGSGNLTSTQASLADSKIDRWRVGRISLYAVLTLIVVYVIGYTIAIGREGT